MKRLLSILGLLCLGSCGPMASSGSQRVLLAKSLEDDSSLWDSNGDGIPDVERWYRGSNIAYEKIDRDFDGFWDAQGRRHSDGSFETDFDYPAKKYPVATHHVFYATKSHPADVTVAVRYR